MSKKVSRLNPSPQPRYGQFDRSFVLRVIRNFVISALLLLLFLLALTYFIFRYQFENEVPEQSRLRAV